MPISNSYPKGIPIEDQDLFVGTKAYNNRTVNYTAQGVADYLNINSKVAIGGQMSFQFTIVPNIPKTIAFEGGLGNNTAFSAINKLIVSAIDVSTADITIFLNYLNNSQVLLSQQNQPNFFGHYKITGYVRIGTSAFYELDLEFIGGNGNIVDKQYYDLVSFVLSAEATPTEWGSITGDIDDQTDLIDYISSQITIPTLQEVLDNNHNLVDGNFFAGTDAGNGNTSFNVIGIGTNAAISNSGNSVNALGQDAGSENTGYEVNALGSFAALGNVGNNVNALGTFTGTNNIYNNVNLFGAFANASEDGQTVLSKDGIIMARISTNSLTDSRDYILPNASGTIALITDITTPTLQQVTDEGNTITTDFSIITIGNDSVSIADVSDPTLISAISAGGFLANSANSQTQYQYNKIYYADETTNKILEINYPASIVSTNKVQTFQDADGTIALLSDIGVTSVTATSPITSSGGATPDISTSMSTNKLIGRSTAGVGVMEEITIGTGLTLSGGTLNASAEGVTSVGLTMPSAFTVTNSPITSSGDIAVTGAGLVSQYVRGDGTLANFPNSTGGGSSVNYYLNGSVSQGTFGGDTYYQMSKTPILGAGTNFTRTNGAGNGYIASFITDAGDPSFLNIPGGNWNLEFYFQSSASGGSPQFYGEIYKVSATNVFTLVASGVSNPEGITNGTTVDQYFTSIPVPQTSLLITDRLAIRIYVITGGRTITLHTENGNLCEVLTTFTTGLTALNGLTQQVQNLAVGTSGTDFAISSATDTHTFNLPTASASNRGALSSADWSTFNGKQNPLSYTPYRNVQTSQTTYTGTTAETIVFTATIPAGAFNSVDVLKILFGANKTTGLGAYSLRLRVNTTNTISGAPTIALYTGSASSQVNVMMRNFNLNGGNLYGLAGSASGLTDIVVSGSALGSNTLNPANTFYLFATVQLGNSGDSIIGNMFTIHN